MAVLKSRGLRGAAIKHAHHKVELDQEGKDSWRYKQAGAVMSMLVTANELQLVADATDRREPAQLAERFLGEADMIPVVVFVLLWLFARAGMMRRALWKPVLLVASSSAALVPAER